MKKKKLALAMAFIISLFVIVQANYVNNNFNNTLSIENLTFPAEFNISRHIELEKYANVSSASINLSGYLDAMTNFIKTPDCQAMHLLVDK